MKKIFLFFIIIAFCQCSAQNLVPNGDLEQFVKHYSGVCLDSSYLTALNWYSPTNGTPDYCNTLSCWNNGVPQNVYGYQSAHSGNGYFMLGIYKKNYTFEFREYFQVALTDSLRVGKKYNVKFYVSLCDSAQYAIDDIGALFTVNPLIDTVTNPPPVLLFVPQITNSQGNFLASKTDWMIISGSFTASGKEKYLTIGNFKNDANTDTLSVPGGGNPIYNWGALYYFDDISVELDTTNGINENALKQLIAKVYPNPARDWITYSTGFTNRENSTLAIYNIIGGKILEQNLNAGQKEYSVNISTIAQGIYIIKVSGAKGVQYHGKLVIQK